MSFPRYPVYKDSGVEWLGEVPDGWEICALGRLAKEIQTGPFGSQLHSSDYVPDQIPVINPSNIKHGRIVPDWDCTITRELAAALDQHALRAGDIVLARRGEMGRCAAVSKAEAGWITGTGSLRVRLSFSETPAFWSHYLGTPFVRDWLLLESVGATIDNLNASIVSRVPVCAPPPTEQAAIATFLDRETAKIDALVADYRALIELLQEKRQAVISHAVTKGLDPSVPMKDSGVEWLGEVPEHWVVLTMQRCVAVAEGQVDPRESPYIDMLLIAPNHVESGTGKILEFETAAEQGADSGKYLCDAGSVVYSKIRPALRKVCIAPQACLCSADMYPLQGRCGLSNFFLLWVILSEQFSSLHRLQ